MNPIERMAAYEQSYSEAEDRVYRTIREDPQIVRTHTITKVGELAGASPSAVMRFCQRMGYAGYKEFRFDMIKYLSESDSSSSEEGASSRVARAFGEACVSLKDIDQGCLSDLACDLAQADLVFCLGVYRSYLPAEKLRMDLVDQGIRAVSESDSVAITRVPYIASERSAVVIFSESGDDKGYRSMLESVGHDCHRTYLITCTEGSPLSPLCDRTLVLPRPVPTRGGSPDAHAIMFVLIEMLKALMQVGND